MNSAEFLWATPRLALLAAASLAAAGPAVAQNTSEESTPVITVTAPRTVTSPVRRHGRGAADKAVITLQISVRYADLDLADPADAARLMIRVEGAARDACRQLDRLYPLDKDKDCVVRAVGDARPGAQAVIDAAGGQKPAK